MSAFPKSARLLRRADFLKMSAKAKKSIAPNFILLFCESGLATSRLGITVSKKVGNSVARNRLKRLIREFYRNNREKLPALDYNIIARSGARYLSYAAVCQELANALSRIGQRHSG